MGYSKLAQELSSQSNNPLLSSSSLLLHISSLTKISPSLQVTSTVGSVKGFSSSISSQLSQVVPSQILGVPSSASRTRYSWAGPQLNSLNHCQSFSAALYEQIKLSI